MTENIENESVCPTLIFEASTGSFGAVVRGREITENDAVIRRQAGLDVVVCGPDLATNRRLAGQKGKQTVAISGVRHIRMLGSTPCRTINRKPGRPKVIRFMKPNTAKPSDCMQYFTPELYLRFNSSDDAIADQAQQEWDAAIVAYQAHLQRIRDQLPKQVRELSERDFHDAGLLKFEIDASGNQLPEIAFLMIQDHQQITALVYVLAAPIVHTPAAEDWNFSSQPLHWLYDEIDVRDGGGFVQRILLNSGRVLIIPFLNAFLHEVPQSLPTYRQTA